MKFHFPEPLNEGYTIYCKTACINCEKTKGFLKGENEKVKFIYCDLYLEDSICRTEF
jgi:arsenate reductase-like glutaredoxin family protein